jgi:beta-fructofuranosidase
MIADSIQSNALGEFAWCCFGSFSSPILIETTIRFSDQTRGCGIVFKADKILDRYYKIQLEPGRNRIIFERRPRPGDEAPIVERPVELKPESPILLQVIVDGTAVVAYINNQVAMSARAYESSEEFVGLFVTEGGAVFQETSVRSWSE